jgi:hypothetical protein
VPGLDEAVRQAVRYTRAQPGWDESQTLGEDLLELDPLRHFAASHLAWLASSRMEPEEASAAVVLLGKHLDYCVNFELCRRKCFLVDAPLAWLLGLTSLDIEGRMLRLPFACFAVVFTDRATLEIAEALLQPPGGELVEGRLHILTAYVTRTQAPRGTSGLRLSMVFDSRCGEWPYLLVRELRFTDDDDLDAMLDRVGQGAEVDASGRPLDQAKTRRLIHLLVNAILYANSADLPWPLAPSPIRALQAKAQRRGEAKQARVAHRAQELRKQYSEEDVFFLPGRIPISQLRALREVEQGPRGGEVMARFMVRGHWRRAAKGWVNQRLRWIEPYWKGPEWGPIMEKDYRLKV